MQHMKRHVIILTAWVLVLVTALATPASAASLTGFQILISDLEVNTENTGLKSVTEYSYPGSYGSTSTFTYRRPNSTSYLSGFTDQYTATSTGSFSYDIYPGRYKAGSKFATQTDLYYFDDLLLFNDISSCKLTSSFMLSSDADTSGHFICTVNFVDSERLSSDSAWTYSIKGTARHRIDYELSALEYKEFNFEVDILDKMLNSGADCFFVEYSLYFKDFPSGATLSWSNSTPSNSYDDLSKGFRVFLTTEKTIDPPIITSQPGSYYAYNTDSDSFSLSVSATFPEGGLPAFQWYKGLSAATAEPITGAVSATYTEQITGPSDYYYYCVVTNVQHGATKSVKSNSSHVVVVDPPQTPQITQNLADGATLEYVQGITAGPLTISAITTDDGKLTYQWYSYVADGENILLPGYTGSSFTPPTDEIGTKYYFCVVTNTKAGFTARAYSGTVGIRVVSPPDPALPPVITSDLKEEYSFREGTTGILSLSAVSPDGGTLSYHWFFYTDDDSVFAPVTGDSPTLILDTSKSGKYYYFCVVQNNLNDTSAAIQSGTAVVIIEEDDTGSLLDTIIGGIQDIIDGILGLPQMFIDGIKGLFVPDEEALAAYQDRWFSLLASRFGAIYQAVMLIDEFGQAISDQAASGVVDFPQVTINLAGTPFVFGGWQVDVVPDGFDLIFDALKLMIDIVATLAFVNGLRHRFEGILGGE